MAYSDRIDIRRFLVVPLLLLIPLVAMQFTPQVLWSLADFVVAAALLSALILGVELIRTRVRSRRGRLLLLAFTATVFLLLWVELAVGLFGSPLAGS